MAFLEIRNLHKAFGSLEVLKDINLEIEKGGFLVLVGPSGCGKSTLLHTIAGLEPLTSGQVFINGRDVSAERPSQRDIAMVFQSYALYPNMTVAQNIGFGMETRGVPKPEREKAIASVADMLQIHPLLARKPSQLSGGQRQRVAMGRALVRDPQVFLFDEPLSNLDAKLRVDMRTEIKRLHQRMEATIVYVTHDQIEAMTLASKIAVLKDGVLQQFGAPAEIYNRPDNMFVADFMGSPSMNLIPARLVNRDGRLHVAVSAAGGEIAIAAPEGIAGLNAYEGREIVFGIRPEALTDPEAAERGGARIEHVECHIEVLEPAGSDTYAITRLGEREVTARLRADSPIAAGRKATLAFNLDKALCFDPQTETRIA